MINIQEVVVQPFDRVGLRHPDSAGHAAGYPFVESAEYM